MFFVSSSSPLTILFISFQGKASGRRKALWLRSKLQEELFKLGRLVQSHAGTVLFVGVVLLLTACVGLKGAVMETKLERLWVEGKKKKVSMKMGWQRWRGIRGKGSLQEKKESLVYELAAVAAIKRSLFELIQGGDTDLLSSVRNEVQFALLFMLLDPAAFGTEEKKRKGGGVFSTLVEKRGVIFVSSSFFKRILTRDWL